MVFQNPSTFLVLRVVNMYEEYIEETSNNVNKK